MADEIIVRYKAVPDGFTEVNQAVNAVTNETKELQNQIKATFAEKSIDEATRALYEQGDVMGALITKYGDATKANKALQKELKTMAALGQQNTKEYKELAKAAAEMEDALGDTRNEVKRLASDTRLLDNVAQAGRGMAAAFSVAAGLSAALGSENENLQKTLAKVQGAMATLQGVQELANIATEKGGIATVAYGAALKGVEAISKTFGISMQASWALATGGLSILVVGVIALIDYLKTASSESDRLAQKEKDRQKQFGAAFSEQLNAIDMLDKAHENEAKKAKLRGQDEVKLEKRYLLERLSLITQLQQEVKYNRETNAIDEKTYKELSTRLETERLDTLLNLRKDHSKKVKAIREEEMKLDNLAAFTLPEQTKDLVVTEVKSLQGEMQAELDKLPPLTVKFETPLGDELQQQAALMELQSFLGKYMAAFRQTVDSISQIVSQASAVRTQRLQDESTQQLEILNAQYEIDISKAGNNAKKREQIDKRYAAEKKKMDKELAISQAKINRDQAIANKALALANVAINIAEAVSKYAGQGPAGYIQMALAIGLGAAQTAIIAATPIPEIPKFEKGGAVPLVGGRIDDGHLVGRSHRDGGILINAQGGEYIWDIPTVKKHGDIIRAAHENSLDDLIFHKYVAPMVSNLESLSAAAYDDALLRNEVRKTRENDNKNAKMIVSGIATAISDNIYFSQRYR